MNLERTKFVDSHAHVQFSEYDADRDEVIEKALNAGVWMVNSGSDLENSESAVKLAEKYESGVYATVGIHPSENSQLTTYNSQVPTLNSQLATLALSPKVVAIGECGLEYFPDTSGEEKESQAELFIDQIDLANKVGKPLVIHCRDAYEDLYRIIENNEGRLLNEFPALMHFFSGTPEDARKFLEMGFVFSFGGAATFPPKPNKTDFVSLVKELPLSSILLETDCPYVTPEPIRGKRNEPLFVTYVAEKLAEIRGIPSDELAEATTENALKFFAIEKASR
ncbi:MAG: TatD family hydrolase [Parcubacteria group bacterium]